MCVCNARAYPQQTVSCSPSSQVLTTSQNGFRFSRHHLSERASLPFHVWPSTQVRRVESSTRQPATKVKMRGKRETHNQPEPTKIRRQFYPPAKTSQNEGKDKKEKKGKPINQNQQQNIDWNTSDSIRVACNSERIEKRGPSFLDRIARQSNRFLIDFETVASTKNRALSLSLARRRVESTKNMASKATSNDGTTGGGEGGGSTSKSSKALQETLQLVSKSLLPSIEMFGSNEESYSHDDGLDFLHVKNSLLLSYLIELTVYCRETHTSGKNNNKKKNKRSVNDTTSMIKRLNEMKVVLDKMRGLDKKLRYQIDKLLAASSNASSFAVAGEGVGGDNTTNMPSLPEDPLQFRPNPRSLEQNDSSDDSSSDDDDDDDDDDSKNSDKDDDPIPENDDDDNDDDDDEADDDDDDDDEDLQAAKATLSMARVKKSDKKKSYSYGSDDDDDDDDNDGLYRAPRLSSVPYTHDVERKQKQKEKQTKRRMRASELALMLKSQYGDAPEQEDVHGGGDFGKQKAAARRMAEKEAEKTRYEESTMVRLATSRQEKKDRKRLMREEHSNLSAIASNLNNLVDDAHFGMKDDDGDDDDDDMYPPRFGGDKKKAPRGNGKRTSGGYGAAAGKGTKKRRRTK